MTRTLQLAARGIRAGKGSFNSRTVSLAAMMLVLTASLLLAAIARATPSPAPGPALQISTGILEVVKPNGSALDPYVAYDQPSSGQPVQPQWPLNASIASGLATSNVIAGLRPGDIVRFGIVVANYGSGSEGAFNVTVNDVLGRGLTGIPSSVSVQDGCTGANLPLVPADTSPSTLFTAGGIEFADPSPTQGSLGADANAPNLSADCQSFAFITFKAVLGVNVGTKSNPRYQLRASCYTNTGTILGYAATPSGANLAASASPLNDDATLCPELKHSIDTTSEASTPDAGAAVSGDDVSTPRPLAVGEIVRYRIQMELPEGVSPSLTITDHLPDGMAYVGNNTRIAFVRDNLAPNLAPSISSSNPNLYGFPDRTGNQGNVDSIDTPDSGALNGWKIPSSADPHGIVNIKEPAPFEGTLARSVFTICQTGVRHPELVARPQFSLGNVTNLDDDPNSEYVVIEFNALVCNDTAHNTNDIAGPSKDNWFTEQSPGPLSAAPGPVLTSNHVYAQVVEPLIVATKTMTTAPPNLTYTVAIANHGAATAADFQVIDRALSGLAGFNGASTTITGGSGTTGLTHCTHIASVKAPFILTVNCPGSLMPVNGTLTITYRATPAFPSAICVNQATVNWSTLPGTHGTTQNSTGSYTPGGDSTYAQGGKVHGERMYAVQAQIVNPPTRPGCLP